FHFHVRSFCFLLHLTQRSFTFTLSLHDALPIWMLLIRAPFAEGATFPRANLTLYGHAGLFDVTPTVERPSHKIRTSGFFSDFAELKPGDFVVHVDHGIGQFEGLRQIESDGHRGEFMLLRYLEDARLY